MIDEKASNCMIPYFKRLLEFYEKFLCMEKEKQELLKTGKLNQLDQCMKKEEAFVLKARGLEQERIELMKLTPQPNARFKEMIPEFPDKYRTQLQSLYEKLSDVLTKLKETNRKNNLLTERMIRQASAVIGKLKSQPELQKIYGKKLKNSSQAPVVFSKKI